MSTPKISKKFKMKKKAEKFKMKKKAKKSRKSGKSSYEEEEEFSNWAMSMSPAAYGAVVAKDTVSKYADESEEEYEDEEEEYESRHQVYTAADFTRAASPLNLTILLMVLLFVILIISRR